MKNEYIKLIKKIFNENVKSLKAKGYHIKVYNYLNEYSVTLFFNKYVVYTDIITNDTVANAIYLINKMRTKIILRTIERNAKD